MPNGCPKEDDSTALTTRAPRITLKMGWWMWSGTVCGCGVHNSWGLGKSMELQNSQMQSRQILLQGIKFRL